MLIHSRCDHVLREAAPVRVPNGCSGFCRRVQSRHRAGTAHSLLPFSPVCVQDLDQRSKRDSTTTLQTRLRNSGRCVCHRKRQHHNIHRQVLRSRIATGASSAHAFELNSTPSHKHAPTLRPPLLCAAGSSPRVTAFTPPITPWRSGFLSRSARLLPCAVDTSTTPR